VRSGPCVHLFKSHMNRATPGPGSPWVVSTCASPQLDANEDISSEVAIHNRLRPIASARKLLGEQCNLHCEICVEFDIRDMVQGGPREAEIVLWRQQIGRCCEWLAMIWRSTTGVFELHWSFLDCSWLLSTGMVMLP
jgi:hypothetical protein